MAAYAKPEPKLTLQEVQKKYDEANAALTLAEAKTAELKKINPRSVEYAAALKAEAACFDAFMMRQQQLDALKSAAPAAAAPPPPPPQPVAQPPPVVQPPAPKPAAQPIVSALPSWMGGIPIDTAKKPLPQPAALPKESPPPAPSRAPQPPAPVQSAPVAPKVAAPPPPVVRAQPPQPPVVVSAAKPPVQQSAPVVVSAAKPPAAAAPPKPPAPAAEAKSDSVLSRFAAAFGMAQSERKVQEQKAAVVAAVVPTVSAKQEPGLGAPAGGPVKQEFVKSEDGMPFVRLGLTSDIEPLRIVATAATSVVDDGSVRREMKVAPRTMEQRLAERQKLAQQMGLSIAFDEEEDDGGGAPASAAPGPAKPKPKQRGKQLDVVPEKAAVDRATVVKQERPWTVVKRGPQDSTYKRSQMDIINRGKIYYHDLSAEGKKIRWEEDVIMAMRAFLAFMIKNETKPYDGKEPRRNDAGEIRADNWWFLWIESMGASDRWAPGTSDRDVQAMWTAFRRTTCPLLKRADGTPLLEHFIGANMVEQTIWNAWFNCLSDQWQLGFEVDKNVPTFPLFRSIQQWDKRVFELDAAENGDVVYWPVDGDDAYEMYEESVSSEAVKRRNVQLAEMCVQAINTDMCQHRPDGTLTARAGCADTHVLWLLIACIFARDGATPTSCFNALQFDPWIELVTDRVPLDVRTSVGTESLLPRVCFWDLVDCTTIAQVEAEADAALERANIKFAKRNGMPMSGSRIKKKRPAGTMGKRKEGAGPEGAKKKKGRSVPAQRMISGDWFTRAMGRMRVDLPSESEKRQAAVDDREAVVDDVGEELGADDQQVDIDRRGLAYIDGYQMDELGIKNDIEFEGLPPRNCMFRLRPEVLEAFVCLADEETRAEFIQNCEIIASGWHFVHAERSALIPTAEVVEMFTTFRNCNRGWLVVEVAERRPQPLEIREAAATRLRTEELDRLWIETNYGAAIRALQFEAMLAAFDMNIKRMSELYRLAVIYNMDAGKARSKSLDRGNMEAVACRAFRDAFETHLGTVFCERKDVSGFLDTVAMHYVNQLLEEADRRAENPEFEPGPFVPFPRRDVEAWPGVPHRADLRAAFDSVPSLKSALGDPDALAEFRMSHAGNVDLYASAYSNFSVRLGRRPPNWEPEKDRFAQSKRLRRNEENKLLDTSAAQERVGRRYKLNSSNRLVSVDADASAEPEEPAGDNADDDRVDDRSGSETEQDEPVVSSRPRLFKLGEPDPHIKTRVDSVFEENKKDFAFMDYTTFKMLAGYPGGYYKVNRKAIEERLAELRLREHPEPEKKTKYMTVIDPAIRKGLVGKMARSEMTPEQIEAKMRSMYMAMSGDEMQRFLESVQTARTKESSKPKKARMDAPANPDAGAAAAEKPKKQRKPADPNRPKKKKPKPTSDAPAAAPAASKPPTRVAEVDIPSDMKSGFTIEQVRDAITNGKTGLYSLGGKTIPRHRVMQHPTSPFSVAVFSELGMEGSKTRSAKNVYDAVQTYRKSHPAT